jgi:hypothetical protein
MTPSGFDPLMVHLVDILKKDQSTVGFADGSPGVVGYEVGGITQSLYLDQSTNKEFVVVWVSSTSRKYYEQQTENRIQDQQFDALNIGTNHADLFQTITDSKPCASGAQIPPAMIRVLGDYMETGDIVCLSKLLDQFTNHNFERLIDISSKQSFMLVRSDDGCLLAVANLLPLNSSTTMEFNEAGLDRMVVQEFVNSRFAWLVAK